MILFIYRALWRTLRKLVELGWIRGPLQRHLLIEPFIAKLRISTEARPRVWFHASSVGEIEALWPLVESLGGLGDSAPECVITVYSRSAGNHLNRLVAKYPYRNILFAGYSPFEGVWKSAFLAVKPALFITLKYEAWPDLWGSLSECKIPLWIFGAQLRRSLQVAKFTLRLSGVGLPQIRFFPYRETHRDSLLEFSREAGLKIFPDPRWERAASRMEVESAETKSLVKRFSEMPRPWVVLGSGYASDLQFLLQGEEWKTFAGTLWIFPHRIDSASCDRIAVILRHHGFSVVFSTSAEAGDPRLSNSRPVVLVNQMGFLLEFYRFADLVYVGGGFEGGIHSTIEPAVGGARVFSGPKKAFLFDEVADLVQQNRLTITDSATHRDLYWAEARVASRERQVGDAPAFARWMAEKRTVRAQFLNEWREFETVLNQGESSS